MVKHYIIATTNEIKTYYSFLPTVYQMWKKHIPECIFVLGLISDRSEGDPFVERVKEFCDDFYLFKTYPDIHTGVQAKTTRMHLASLYGSNICTMVDVDQYVMNFDWLKENIKPAFEDNKFVSIGYNGYVNTISEGKWLMPYTTASSDLFKKIVNYNNYDTYEKWLHSFKKINNPIDNKETITNPFDKFSDESLLRYLFETHPDKESLKNNHVKQDMKDYVQQRCPYRIDRGRWQEFTLNRLYSNYYLDCWPLRPFNENFVQLIPILQFLCVGGDGKKLFF